MFQELMLKVERPSGRICSGGPIGCVHAACTLLQIALPKGPAAQRGERRCCMRRRCSRDARTMPVWTCLGMWRRASSWAVRRCCLWRLSETSAARRVPSAHNGGDSGGWRLRCCRRAHDLEAIVVALAAVSTAIVDSAFWAGALRPESRLARLASNRLNEA